MFEESVTNLAYLLENDIDYLQNGETHKIWDNIIIDGCLCDVSIRRECIQTSSQTLEPQQTLRYYYLVLCGFVNGQSPSIARLVKPELFNGYFDSIVKMVNFMLTARHINGKIVSARTFRIHECITKHINGQDCTDPTDLDVLVDNEFVEFCIEPHNAYQKNIKIPMFCIDNSVDCTADIAQLTHIIGNNTTFSYVYSITYGNYSTHSRHRYDNAKQMVAEITALKCRNGHILWPTTIDFCEQFDQLSTSAKN